MTLIPPSSHGDLVSLVTALTPSQVSGLSTSPVVLVAAPGAGYAVVPVSATLALTAGSFAYQADADVTLHPLGVTTNWLKAATVAFTSTAGSVRPTVLQATTATSYSLADLGGVALAISASTDPLASGAILTAAPDAGDQGIGYAVNDTGVITSELGLTSGAYRVTTIGAAGAVTGIAVTAAGTGFVPGTEANTTATTGAGTGLGVDILTIGPPFSTDVRLLVSVAYYIAQV